MSPVLESFSFNRQFQTEILALMTQDSEFLVLAQGVIEPEFFTDRILIWFYKVIRDYYLDYQMTMPVQLIKNELLKAVRLRSIKDEDQIKNYVLCYDLICQPVRGKEYITKELIAFCKQQAIKNHIMEIPSLLAGQQFSEIEVSFKKAITVGDEYGSIGTNYFTDWLDRLKERTEKYELRIMPTGITELDIYIGGGLKPKQLGIWMGPTGRGKSVALSHCGKRAIIYGKKVMHYTCELSEDEISTRYDAAFSKIPMIELAEREAELMRKLSRMGLRWGSSLIIKEFPPGMATVATLIAHLNQCERMGFVPDLILVDYIDLLKPSHHRVQKREELSDITTELRGMAVERNVPIWSGTQSQRIAISMETHTEEQVGEDIGKMNIADIVVTINQTREEVMNNRIRLFLAKNRNGRKYMEIPIMGNLDRMAFYIPNPSGEVENNPLPPVAAKGAYAKRPPKKS